MLHASRLAQEMAEGMRARVSEDADEGELSGVGARAAPANEVVQWDFVSPNAIVEEYMENMFRTVEGL